MALNIHEFIAVNGIDIDGLFVDRFWSALDNDDMIVVDRKTMEWLGYEDEAKGAQQSVSRLLEKYSIPYDKIDVGDERSAQFPSIAEEASSMGQKNLHRKRWIVMSCDDFKFAASLAPASGIRIKQYFRILDRLWRQYNAYILQFKGNTHQQNTFALLKAHREETVALLKAHREETGAQEEAYAAQEEAYAAREEAINAALQPYVSKRPGHVGQEEVICIVGMSSDYVYCDETDPEYVLGSAAVIIRCQKRALTNRIRGVRKWGDDTNVKADVLLLKQDINAVNVVNHIRCEGRYELVMQGLRLREGQTMELFVEFVESYCNSLYSDVIANIRSIFASPPQLTG